eukprot:gene18218-biopygen21932
MPEAERADLCVCGGGGGRGRRRAVGCSLPASVTNKLRWGRRGRPLPPPVPSTNRADSGAGIRAARRVFTPPGRGPDARASGNLKKIPEGGSPRQPDTPTPNQNSCGLSTVTDIPPVELQEPTL